MSKNEHNVAAIVLNWRSPGSTIACVKSVLDSDVVPSVVIIVDNNSNDQSVEEISCWCSSYEKWYYASNSNKAKVILLNSESNKGYAGGNNLGIEYARKEFNAGLYWILNNDVLVKPDSLYQLIEVSKRNKKSFVSSVTLTSEGLIEAYGGGKYYPLLGKSRLLYKNKTYNPHYNVSVNYLMGASLLVPDDVIKDVGKMDECFFMYSEEIDWQWRSQLKGYGIKVAPKSIVCHEGSFSSESYQYHYYRNRAAMHFNSIYFGCLFSVFSSMILSGYFLLRYIFRPKILYFGIKGIVNGICKKRKNKMGPLA